MVAPAFNRLLIATSRGSDVLRCDRLATNLTSAADRRQFSWSHFRRNLLSVQELAKDMPQNERVCQ